MAAAQKKKKSGTLLYIAMALLFVAGFAGYKMFGPNTDKFVHGEFLYIHTGANYEQVKAALQEGGFVADMSSFGMVANMLSLSSHIHPGKYKVNKFMSNYNLVRLLRSGKQTQVKLVINKLRTKHDFASFVGMNLEADSNDVERLLNDQTYLAKYGLDTNTAMCLVIPNTHFFKWNTNAERTLEKLGDYYKNFWNDSRKAAARTQDVTPEQAVIVASIVDEETNLNEDKPKIASVYLNRLKKNMKLQADPTVKFAVGDFTIKRIAGAMLDNPSPYNTYKYAGLPPGPICTPAISSIEAVLRAPKTTFLYFCAKEDFSGHSNFASTYDEQLKNARAYQKALDARGIH